MTDLVDQEFRDWERDIELDVGVERIHPRNEKLLAEGAISRSWTKANRELWLGGAESILSVDRDASFTGGSYSHAIVICLSDPGPLEPPPASVPVSSNDPQILFASGAAIQAMDAETEQIEALREAAYDEHRRSRRRVRE